MSEHTINLSADDALAHETAEIARELVGYAMGSRFGDTELQRLRGERLNELAPRLAGPGGLAFSASLILSLAAYAVDMAQVGALIADSEIWTPERIVSVAAEGRRQLGCGY